MEIIKSSISKVIPTPSKPLFKFELNEAAANHNWKILQKYPNLGSALEDQKNSPLGYGSEFCPSSFLEPIFKLHPLWPRFKSILDSGSRPPLEPLSSELRKKDLEEAIEFGNHKGVSKHKKFFQNLIKRDVINKFSMTQNNLIN